MEGTQLSATGIGQVDRFLDDGIMYNEFSLGVYEFWSFHKGLTSAKITRCPVFAVKLPELQNGSIGCCPNRWHHAVCLMGFHP